MKRTLTLFLAALVVIGAGCKKKSNTGPSATVTSVLVSGPASYVNKGQTGQLLATANMSDGAPTDVTSTATWSSNAPTIAAVSATGLVTAVNNGTASISALSGGQTGSLSVAVSLAAQPQLTISFYRLCGPKRARMEATIAEASNNAGMDINALTLVMTDIYGVTQYNHTFTPAEIATAIGSNHLGAGQSKLIAAEQTYIGGVDTEDSTGSASMTTTDDFGHAVVTNTPVPFQRDGC